MLNRSYSYPHPCVLDVTLPRTLLSSSCGLGWDRRAAARPSCRQLYCNTAASNQNCKLHSLQTGALNKLCRPASLKTLDYNNIIMKIIVYTKIILSILIDKYFEFLFLI